MKEIVTLEFRRKHTHVKVDVHVRPHILTRHQAMRDVLGYPTLGAYFDELMGRERMEDALDFVVNPYFGGFTKVEFAQELIDTAFSGIVMPWGNETTDMSEEQFRDLMDAWALEFPSTDERIAIGAIGVCALNADGAGVRELVAPIAARLQRQIILDAELEAGAAEHPEAPR